MRFSDRLLGRWLPVAALTVVGAAAAAVFAYTAANRYDATSQLIVSPVSASDPTYLGLGLLRDTGGKRTAAASAAVLLRSPQVADAVRTELGLTRSRDSLLAALHAHAVAGSDIVDVTVRDTSAVRAAQLANAFASALVAQRTASFQSQLTSVIRRVRQQLLALPPSQRTTGTGAALQQRLTVLESLQGQPDPTIRPADQAEAPSSPAWPNRPLIVGAGAGAGLLLGLVVVGIVALVRRKPKSGEASTRSVERLAAGAAPRSGPSPELRRLEKELEERSAAVAAREEQVDARNEEIERRTTELEERAHALERRTGELETRTETQIEEANAREAEAREAAERAAEERAAAEARTAEEREAREREATEREQAERERAEREQAEREAREREAAEREQAEREAAEREAAEREQAEREAAEREAHEREAAEREQAEREAEREAHEREAAEREQAEREQAERERTEREQAEREAAEREVVEREAAEREAAERAAREREEAERRAAIRAPAPLPLEPVLAGAPAYRPAAPTNGVGRGHWNLVELERLVEERGREFPDRLDEWESYLFFLRDYAEPDGSVPASFDWLIEDEFAEIV